MKRNVVLTIILFLSAICVRAQLNCTFTHYTQENGLSQNTIMDMIQDSDGLIWFATWNGINRFDGYEFRIYKAHKDNDSQWSSNRVDKLDMDSHGNVWCLSYDGRAFRFDKRQEAFHEIKPKGDIDFFADRIYTLNNSSVWLLSPETGAVRVTGDCVTFENYGKVNRVFLDSRQHEWVLTDDGLRCIDAKTNKQSTYFATNKKTKAVDKQNFLSAVEADGKIYFGSDKGRIWVNDIKTGEFTMHTIDANDDVFYMESLKNGKLLIVTRQNGIAITDKKLEKTEWLLTAKSFDFNRYPVLAVRPDPIGNTWIGVKKVGCVIRVAPEKKEFTVEQLEVEQDAADRSNPVFCIASSNNGNVWVHPEGGGLSIFNPFTKRLEPFFNSIRTPQLRFSTKLHSMMVDRQGNLWLGTHSKGLEKVTFFFNEFNLTQPKDCNDDTNANKVRAIFEDSKKRIWAGTRDGKISIYEAGTLKPLGYLSAQGQITRQGAPFIGSAYKIIEDSKGTIWIATKGKGVIRLTAEGNSYRMDSFVSNPNDVYSLSHNSVYDICEDGKGRLWFVTFGGGIDLLESTANGSCRFINAHNNLKGYPMERCLKARRMLRDAQGRLWVGTSNGLLSFDENFSRPENIAFHLYTASNSPETLSSNDIYDILQTKDNRLFFATFGGGLNELKQSKGNQTEASFIKYGIQDGLPSDVLISLAADSKNNLWIASESGLCKFGLKEKNFENYLKQELGSEINFEEGTATSGCDGTLYFGSNRGIVSFDPDNISKSANVPPIFLARLKVMNEEILPTENGILQKSLNEIESISLSHRQNTISITYATLDMSFPENVRYAYKLEGFDNDWNYVDWQRAATYTNLPKGNYVFRVKSTNGAGIWVDNERDLRITVRPSFWETPWAYLLFVIGFLTMLLIGTYILFIIYRLKHEVSVEQKLTDMKLRFFTNISHELRTPLTLIDGPVNFILRRSDLNDEVRESLKVVERNTQRMLRLVNQILDFRKIQNNKMKLRVEHVEIVSFTQRIMENFQTIAEENRIDFLFETEKSQLYLWIDADKVEKIIFNLLSNAFKYTHPGKNIKLFIHEDENTVSIGVQDQGIGISENKRKSLFVRFETLLDRNLFAQNSSGIGLSLVKELVDMHHATIDVESKEGEGSCFTVHFKKGKEHYDDNVEFVVADDIYVTNGNEEPAATTETTTAESEAQAGDPQTLLIVEDNVEMRFFLRSIFAKRFKVIEASNGNEGLEKATTFIPDIIISDVMMPEKDGIQMTRELRNQLATSHIPIVLLTAKTDMDSKLQGMELGVDSYITKPFSAVYLEARVNNLLERRRSLRQFYYEHLMDSTPAGQPEPAEAQEQTQAMSPQDRKFIDKLTELMEKNMDNGDLVVDDLVKEMAVSRSVFFKKLKSLTGLAPVEFIKEMRVKRAANLIESGEFNMTQIAYMVGINDPRYFSKCFKQRFGMTPTEYKDRNKK